MGLVFAQATNEELAINGTTYQNVLAIECLSDGNLETTLNDSPAPLTRTLVAGQVVQIRGTVLIGNATTASVAILK